MTLDSAPTDLEAALGRSFAFDMPLAARERVDRRVRGAMTAAGAGRPSRRWQFRRPVLLAVGLVIVSGLATAVGAGVGLVRLEWGSLPQQQHTPAQVNAEIAAAMATTPVPPGYTFPPLAVAEGSGVWGSYTGQGMVEFNAMCAWYADWTHAFATGDAARLARDRVMMEALLGWKTIADPALADESIREMIRAMNAGADARDPARIDSFLAANCTTP
jgi:hypothetical protein